jgi:BASS family bile acid:Na+ symporter
MMRILAKCSEWFPLWLVLGSSWAWFQPMAWTWFQPWISLGLGVIMLGMGLTLSIEDFRQVVRQPRWVAIGVILQFVIMPLAGWSCAKVFGLSREASVGLLLVACCPGGTASNVICYLARAHVALSVLLTLCSTMIAVVLTPLLTMWLAGQYLPLDGWGLFRSMLQVVLVPLVLGVAINAWFDRKSWGGRARAWVGSVGPLVSVMLIVMVVGSIVAGGKLAIVSAGPLLFVAVFCLHALGFAGGFGIARLLGGDTEKCLTVSVEVGMQNSGLAASLAKSHFAAYAMAPVPAAISAVFHSLMGSALCAVRALGRWQAARVTAEAMAATDRGRVGAGGAHGESEPPHHP